MLQSWWYYNKINKNILKTTLKKSYTYQGEKLNGTSIRKCD